jgi:hypothetical protein
VSILNKRRNNNMTRAEYLRQWRKRTPEKQAVYNERAKERQKKNRAECSAREKKYRHNLPKGKRLEWDRGYKAKLRAERPWVLWYRGIKDRCNNKTLWYKAKGIKCLITAEEVKELWDKDNAGKMTRPSIHRIKNNGHYSIKNCMFMEYKDHMKLRKGGAS